MKQTYFRKTGFFLIILSLFTVVMNQCDNSSREEVGSLRLIDWDVQTLLEVRQRLDEGDLSLQPALDRLIREADEALNAGPFTVTDKPQKPPSGDKKDYMSIAPFWWPDPDSEDGLPYIWRDGEINPEYHEFDNRRLTQLSSAVQTLSLAWFFTGREAYAEHAGELLRVWFIDEETSMNPHLSYAQAIRGRNEGRYIGLIDTATLLPMLDAVEIMTLSSAWSSRDDEQLRNWFREYKTWFIESEFGRDESAHHNNHGTWHDAQASGYALFVRDTTTAREILQRVGERRIEQHIEPDGRMPGELQRTRGFSYSVYNLRALIMLADRGERLSVDLWGYQTPDGRSIPRALDWLLPYAVDFDPDEFPYEELIRNSEDRNSMLRNAEIIYRWAALATGDKRYFDAVSRISATLPDDRLNLLYPMP